MTTKFDLKNPKPFLLDVNFNDDPYVIDVEMELFWNLPPFPSSGDRLKVLYGERADTPIIVE